MNLAAGMGINMDIHIMKTNMAVDLVYGCGPGFWYGCDHVDGHACAYDHECEHEYAHEHGCDSIWARIRGIYIWTRIWNG